MVTITEGAAERLRRLLAEDGSAAEGLRLSVTRGGCAGFSYALAFAERPGEADQVFESRGVRIFVAADSLPLVAGSEIDFVDTVERTGFAVNNPNVVSACGCGSSFQAKEQAA